MPPCRGSIPLGSKCIVSLHEGRCEDRCEDRVEVILRPCVHTAPLYGALARHRTCLPSAPHPQSSATLLWNELYRS